MQNLITKSLRHAAAERGFRILYACEAGSRAWGTPSPDSDYDIRFIYAHPLAWYLSIENHRDSFEMMLPQDLDFAGWELRKALQLFATGNVSLYEQLLSPTRYFSGEQFHERLLALLPRFFNKRKAIYSYLKTAEQSLQGLSDGKIGIKRFFYVVRPLLSCEWICRDNAMPPIELQRLVEIQTLPVDVKKTLCEIAEQKTTLIDNVSITVNPEVMEWIETVRTKIATTVEAIPAATENQDITPLNKLFYEFITKGV
ncbi:MAG: nucleotidyltransferase domain-containing protein [Planctomycetaceae bacterium]|jgi:predicted nucleotidyltransferase|nr:nucleotidyltransferase domain-containing protein [Planctomycetaceae bacterium]